MTNESHQLLAEYCATGSEAAFRELVARYISFVFSTASRLVNGDAHLAEDVTQMVFISLARKAPTLSGQVMLGGWLHQCTYHIATKAIRGERRRQSRERAAVEMSTMTDNSGSVWRQIAPLLDQALTQLKNEDRAAILLRFFEQRDFRNVAEAIGTNEDAARMRVNRALAKLQALLKQQGVSLPARALGTVLTVNAVSAAPAGLAPACVSLALVSAAATAGTSVGFLKFMAATKLKTGLMALVIAGAAGMFGVQHNSKLALRMENQGLHRKIAEFEAEKQSLSSRRPPGQGNRLSHPSLQSAPSGVAPTASSEESRRIAELYGRLMANKPTKLTGGQVEPYLDANRRSAASLLAAFRTTGDESLLQEAMQKYPHDPQVSFEAALRKDAPDKRAWLDTFAQAAPDNALVNYLSAAEYFKAGQTAQAVQELINASRKPEFRDYSLDRVQDDEEAFRSAGYSVSEAKLVATTQLLLPQLGEIKQLGDEITKLAHSYRQAGHEDSARAALLLAANLGHRYSNPAPGESLISQLVGIAIERNALAAMDPQATYGSYGQSVEDRLNQLVQQRAAIRELNQQAEPLFPKMSEQDWISYHSRSATFGEEISLRWLVGKLGQQ